MHSHKILSIVIVFGNVSHTCSPDGAIHYCRILSERPPPPSQGATKLNVVVGGGGGYVPPNLWSCAFYRIRCAIYNFIDFMTKDRESQLDE